MSAQKATSLSFANARVHKVHDATSPQYYAAVSFVVEGGNIVDVEIPTHPSPSSLEALPLASVALQMACSADNQPFSP